MKVELTIPVPPPEVVITLNRTEAASLMSLLKAHFKQTGAYTLASTNFADQLYTKIYQQGVAE